MANLDFLPVDITTDRYLENCWILAFSDKQLGPAWPINGTQVTLELESFKTLHAILVFVLPEFIGFCFYAMIFGISLIASILSLHYLLKKWKIFPSHLIVTSFTLVISSFNIAIFGIRTATVASFIAGIICPFALLNLQVPQYVWPLAPLEILVWTGADKPYPLGLTPASFKVLSLSAIPVFLWVSDAFLLYRAWVIWIHHRKYIIIPIVGFLTSVVCGIVWLVQVLGRRVSVPESETLLLDSLLEWTPALGFSCGLDALTTGMIAGRLIYHHRKQAKLTDCQSTFYLPIVAIFIESAALSFIAKILQLTIANRHFKNNLLVVPLCTISSNLIVLRKALGFDAGQMLANAPQDLSALAFRRRRRHGAPQTSESGDGSVPGGFGSHLIQTIGGHTIVDIRTFNADPENSEQSSFSNVPKL